MGRNRRGIKALGKDDEREVETVGEGVMGSNGMGGAERKGKGDDEGNG